LIGSPVVRETGEVDEERYFNGTVEVLRGLIGKQYVKSSEEASETSRCQQEVRPPIVPKKRVMTVEGRGGHISGFRQRRTTHTGEMRRIWET